MDFGTADSGARERDSSSAPFEPGALRRFRDALSSVHQFRFHRNARRRATRMAVFASPLTILLGSTLIYSAPGALKLPHNRGATS
jgi:hypothetical protein